MPVDPRYIHRLEYDLGFRDDPPLTEGFKRMELTDAPGAVIDYNPILADSAAGKAALDLEIAEARRHWREHTSR